MSAPDPAFTEAVQDGVLSAVLHVAAVSALDARELVLEFDAASEALVEQTVSRTSALALALRGGLSVERLKVLMHTPWTRGGGLESLQQRIVWMDREHGDEAQAFRRMIRTAALAAARAKIEAGFAEQRSVSLEERIALAEISAVLGRAPS